MTFNYAYSPDLITDPTYAMKLLADMLDSLLVPFDWTSSRIGSRISRPRGQDSIKVATSQVDAYPLRVYDVAAYQRLVFIVFQLKRQHAAMPDVAALLKTHPESSTHPVDGRPFSGNSETRELAVNTLGAITPVQRFNVLLQ